MDQEFYNPNPSRLEGTFVFPVPKGAHINKFTMEIDGKQVEAELLAADKARHIYEDIVRKLKDPALLEYAGRDIFKVRVNVIDLEQSSVRILAAPLCCKYLVILEPKPKFSARRRTDGARRLVARPVPDRA